MATSRTGTAQWKHLRATVLGSARDRGQRRCPICKRVLDWDSKRERGVYKPLLPEVDHIVPVERGGADTAENCRVICADCNKKRRTRERARRNGVDARTELEPRTSRAW